MTSRPPVATILLAAAAAFTVAVAASSLWWPFSWDAGIFTWVADSIRHGGLPYRDAWDAKGPFSFYLFALLQYFTGPSMWPVRIFDLALMGTGALAAAAIVRRFAAGAAAAWIVILLLLGYYATDFWNTAQPDAWIGALAAIAMAILVRDDLDARLGIASLAAVLMGVGLVQKPTFLALVPLPGFAALLLPGRPPARRIALAAFLTLLALLPAAMTAAYFAAKGELPRLVEGYVTLNMEMSRQLVGSVPRGLLYTLDFSMNGLAMPLLLPAAIAGAILLWHRDRRACLLLVAWTLGMFLCIAAQRRYWPYHWHPFSWSLAPLAGIGLASVWNAEGVAGRPGRLLTCAALALAVYTLVFPLQRHVREWVQLLRGDFPQRAQYLRQFWTPESDLTRDDLDLADWLTAHTSSTDRVFIWDSPLANALAGRHAPGRVGFFGPLVLAGRVDPIPLGPAQTRLRSEFLSSIAQPETRLLVVSGKAMAGIEPALRKNLPVLFPELRDILARDWTPVDSVGDYHIYARRASGP